MYFNTYSFHSSIVHPSNISFPHFPFLSHAPFVIIHAGHVGQKRLLSAITAFQTETPKHKPTSTSNGNPTSSTQTLTPTEKNLKPTISAVGDHPLGPRI